MTNCSYRSCRLLLTSRSAGQYVVSNIKLEALNLTSEVLASSVWAEIMLEAVKPLHHSLELVLASALEPIHDTTTAHSASAPQLSIPLSI